MEIRSYIDGVIQRAAEVRLQRLTTNRNNNFLCRVNDREGITTFAVVTSDLTEEEVFQIMTFRLAQYLTIGFVDPQIMLKKSHYYEPISNLLEDEVHIMAVRSCDAQMLCYLSIKGSVGTVDKTLKDVDRPLLPVEKLFGWGIFNRLKFLPEIPLNKIRELGRFMKNQKLSRKDDLAIRSPIEVGLACFRLLTTVLKNQINAFVGDFQDCVAKRNLDYFHVPSIMLRGVIPFAENDSYLRAHVESSTVYPFAFLTSDLNHLFARTEIIEEALSKPGKEGILALGLLKRIENTIKSSLIPPTGLDPLEEAIVAQEGVNMAQRQKWIDLGAWLRNIDLFKSLCPTQASILATFLEEISVEPGVNIVNQGERGGSLYLIASGKASIWIQDGSKKIPVAVVDTENYFGEIALMTGGFRTATVTSETPMQLYRLSRDSYSQYLVRYLEIRSQMNKTATNRILDSINKLEQLEGVKNGK